MYTQVSFQMMLFSHKSLFMCSQYQFLCSQYQFLYTVQSLLEDSEFSSCEREENDVPENQYKDWLIKTMSVPFTVDFQKWAILPSICQFSVYTS